MIIHLCDYCGRKTTPGASVSEQRIRHDVSLSKKWAADHTPNRESRVKVFIGIDGISAEPDHKGHDLCRSCQASALRAVLSQLEDGA